MLLYSFIRISGKEGMLNPSAICMPTPLLSDSSTEVLIPLFVLAALSYSRFFMAIAISKLLASRGICLLESITFSMASLLSLEDQHYLHLSYHLVRFMILV